MTLCFVVCRFDFGVLYVEFSVLCTMLHILNGAFHEVEPRKRRKEERKARLKHLNASIVMLVFIYTEEKKFSNIL